MMEIRALVRRCRAGWAKRCLRTGYRVSVKIDDRSQERKSMDT